MNCYFVELKDADLQASKSEDLDGPERSYDCRLILDPHYDGKSAVNDGSSSDNIFLGC